MENNQFIIHKRVLNGRQAEYADFPSSMDKELTTLLHNRGVERLYSHQAEMFEQARSGDNIVITTSTASGKTLSFLLPVLQRILEKPTSRAFFIYPTKALASDQYRSLLSLIEALGNGRVTAGVYDGDTPPNERSRIRKSANIILTNPEMLNGAFLPNHSRYGIDRIFADLDYVVIDELHSYRGIFGSHVANVFRRLSRICSYYGSRPQFLCSSATIANPVELAEAVCGKPFVRISKDGSPAAKRNYYLIQPPRIVNKQNNFIGQTQAATIAAEMVPELVNHKHSFIIFCKSRRNVEVVLRESRDKLDADSLLGHSYADKIAGYRGGYTPIERKTIEKKMTSGDLCGLVSTNALELGIDIGKIDTTVLVGFPGTRASFWQQTGRAGRSGIESNNYVILESQPLDQYVGINPDWLFESSSENAVIDKDNLLIQLAHIRSAAAELPLTLDDIALFPNLGESIPVLMRLGELKSQNGKFAWCGSAFPAGDYSLRNMDERRYKLINKENHQNITEMDELQAFRELHEGAVYLHEGAQYQVVKLDLEMRAAFAVPFEGNYYTMPGGTTEVRIIKEHRKQPFGRTDIMYGDVNVNDIIFMYKKLQFHNHQNLGYENLSHPLSKDYDSESTWIRIPENVVSKFRSLLQVDANGHFVHNNHFDGLCHVMEQAARMVTMTEREDIGVSVSANAIGMANADGDEVFLYIYDKFVGGLGYAEKVYDHIERIIETAADLLAGCNCKNGCAACVGDYTLDRQMVLWGIKSLKEELAPPEGRKFIERPFRPQQHRRYSFSDLPEHWAEFCQYLKERGERLADFLGTIQKVASEGNHFVLYAENPFIQEWVETPINRRSIINIIRSYTDAPASIQLLVQTDASDHQTELESQIRKRYNRMKGEESAGNGSK